VTKPKTAEELLPLVAELALEERTRLLHIISTSIGIAAAGPAASAHRAEELTVDDLLSWDSDGSEHFA
jgi:hypothetical protein